VRIGFFDEIGDSRVDCQSYVAFVIKVVGTPGSSIDPNIMRNEPAASSKARSPRTCRVQQTTRIELIINLKTAKALGIEISPNAARHEEVPALKVGN
jgi:hypothetical protein